MAGTPSTAHPPRGHRHAAPSAGGRIGPIDMMAEGFTLFETAIGRCAIAWGGRGVAGVQLPEGREAETRARVRRQFPGAREAAPPAQVQGAIDGIVALLRGESRDLSGIPLDMDGVPPFHRRVYEIARAIPPGATLSYGEIAARLGAPGSARAVGQALGRNPFAIVVPCHRVLAAGGRPGGFSANGGVATKLRLLGLEGAPAAADAPGLFGDQAAPGIDRALGFDPALAVGHVRESDPVMASLIDAVGPFRMRLERTSSIFLALAQAIVYQQLHGKAAAAIYARVMALFPRVRGRPDPRQFLRATDAKLRAAGLSRAKVLALRDLARRAAAGTVPSLAEARRMDDGAVIERLTEVRGIGRWTVEMLLIFHLGRPDVLPVGDFGVRKGFQVAFRKRALPPPKVVARHGARWRPYRTVAAWYLWRAAEQGKR
jgi:methylated-DNA-[protein]-cysteine S-methyltransferase